MKVTAEGVKTVEQMLKQMGCDQLQGFLLSRPLTPERLVEVVASTAVRKLRSAG